MYDFTKRWYRINTGYFRCPGKYRFYALFRGRERNNCEVGAFGIHWEELDEDLSFEGFL
jgi:hypothetical protein